MLHFDLELTYRDWATFGEDANIFVTGKPQNFSALTDFLERDDFDAFERIGGHFTAVKKSSARVILAQDHLRSFPLFYAVTDSAVVVSDDLEYVRDALGRPGVSKKSAVEFKHLGFVSGSDTLFEGIKQVQAGEILSIDSAGEVSGRFYHCVEYSGRNISDAEVAAEMFSVTFRDELKKMIAQYPDHQLVIPLSGGLDSRLLAVELADLKPDAVLTFTYGKASSSEAQISREVAESLGLRWEFVSYERGEYRAAWQSDEACEFIKYAYAGASLPHVQDFYGISQLRRAGKIADKALFLAGHCVVGAMHDEGVLDVSGAVPGSKIVDLIVGHHVSITARSNELLRDSDFMLKVLDYLDRRAYDGSPVSRVEVLEDFNFLERQTKYINNSMRGYEFFGFDWALPMLETSMFEVWEDFDVELTKNRDWYRWFVNQKYFEATGKQVGEFLPSNVSESKRELVKRVLRRLGLLTFAERIITMRAVENHPMVFDALIGGASRFDLRVELLRGGTHMGIYAREFLNDSWNSKTRIFD